MQVEFKINRNEYAEFIKAAYVRIAKIGKMNRTMFFVNLCAWIFVGMAFAGLFNFYENNDNANLKHLNFAVLFGLIGLFAVIAANLFQRKLYIDSSIGENGFMLGKQMVELNQDYINVVTTHSDSKYSWEAIQFKETTKSLILLYIDNAQAIIIPKSAFKNDEDLQEFIDFIELNAVYTLKV